MPITIPNQSLSTTLTPTEFNQLLEALKDGTRDIITAGVTVPTITAGSLTVTNSMTVTNSSTVGTESVTRLLAATSGTAAVPSLSFTNDTNTGFYWAAADQIGVANNGAATLLVTTDGITMQNDDVRGLRVATFNQLLSASTTATSYTIDWTQAAKQRLMVRNNVTLSFTAPPGVGRFDLRLVQDSVGSRAITWPSTVSWTTNTAPTLTTTAFRTDIITFDYDGTRYAAVGSLNFTGL